MSLLPDLLHPNPVLRIDRHQTRFAIGLAFAGGTSGGLFSDALDCAQRPPDDLGARVLPGRSLPPELRRRVPARARRERPPGLRDRAPPPDPRAPTHRPGGRGAPARHPRRARRVAGAPQRDRAPLRPPMHLARAARRDQRGREVGREPASARHPQAREGRVRSDGGLRLRAIGPPAAGGVRRSHPRGRAIRLPPGPAPVRREPGDAGPQDRRRRRRPDPRLRDRLGGRERGEPVRQLPVAALAGQDRALLPWLWLRRRRGDGAAHRGRVRRAAR